MEPIDNDAPSSDASMPVADCGSGAHAAAYPAACPEEREHGHAQDSAFDKQQVDVIVESEADSDHGPRYQAALPRKSRCSDDERVRTAIGFLSSVLRDMGMDVSVCRSQQRAGMCSDEVYLEIVGLDVGRVIGKKGQVLSALQYLVNRVVNRPGLSRRHIVLDAEGYRHRREASLASLARRLGEQAVKEGKIITFEPMSPRDRRVVHLALAKLPDVITKSDGEGDERRVRIIPVRR